MVFLSTELPFLFFSAVAAFGTAAGVPGLASWCQSATMDLILKMLCCAI